MKIASSALDAFSSLTIVAISLATLYFAYTLVPAPISHEQTALQGTAIGQIHVGPASGRTELFTIDSVTVNGEPVALASRGERTPFAVSRSADIVVSGWALDSRTRQPASHVIAVVDKDITIGPISQARPDVVAAFHLTPDCIINGYRLSIPTKDLDKGVHRLRFLVIGADGASVLETNISIKFTKYGGMLAPQPSAS